VNQTVNLFSEAKLMPDARLFNVSSGPKLKSAHLFMVFSAQDKEASRLSMNASESRMRAFSCVDLRSLFTGNVDGCPIVHPARDLSGPLWKEVAGGLPVSDDMSQTVVAALSGHDSEADSLFVPGMEITPGGLNLINGRYAPPSGDPRQWDSADTAKYRPRLSGLSLRLSDASKRRLETEEDELFVSIDRVFAVFPSQFCMIVAELAVSSAGTEPLSPYAIEEAVHILSNRNRVRESSLASIGEGAEIGLHDLMKLVVPSSRFQLQERIRIYNYSLIVLEEFPVDPDVVEYLAFRCAHHHTTDYRISKDEVAKDIYRPFVTVAHAFALEGAASIVDGSDAYLAEQFLMRVRQVYLWLIVMACHEQSYLLWLVGRDNLNINSSTQKPQKLKELIDDFLEFRLLHSIPLVSNLEMHNQTYEWARRKLHLYELVQKVTHDVVEVERWLTQQSENTRVQEHRRLEAERERRKARRQKYAPGEIFISAFLMFGLTFLAFDALLRKVSQFIWSTPDLPQPCNFLCPVLIGLAAAGLRGWQVSSEIYEEPVSEAMLEEASLEQTTNTEAGVGVVSVSNLR
jgi:hypothetical protein